MNNEWMSKPRNRREAIQSALGMGGLAMGVGMAASGCATAGSGEKQANMKPVDFADPQQSLDSFIKMTGDLDPTVRNGRLVRRHDLW